MSIKTFRDLLIWEKGMELASKTYSIVKMFPKFEDYALSSQMRRAAISIPSNIAEGFGRNSKKEFQHFLRFSLGSLFELETQAKIALNESYLSNDEHREYNDILREMERMLTSFIRSNKKIIDSGDSK